MTRLYLCSCLCLCVCRSRQGSYTYQDYLDSMEGATRSGLMVADEIVARADAIAAASERYTKAQAKVEAAAAA